MTDPDESLTHVGWWCWRCNGINRTACRSDCVPIYVPTDWAEDFTREVVNDE